MPSDKLQNTGFLLIAIGSVLIAVAGLGPLEQNRSLRIAVLLAAIGFAAAGTIYLIRFVRIRRRENRARGD